MPHSLPTPLLQALERLHYTPKEVLAGGASPRVYVRVNHSQGQALAMWTPPSTTPTEHGAKVISSDLMDSPWLLWRTRLEALGLPVPFLYQAEVLPDGQGQLFIIEDLGDERFFDRATHDPSQRVDLYKQALRLLAQWQQTVNAPAFPAPRFNRQHILAELDEFRRMGLEHRLQLTLPPEDRAILDEVASVLADTLKPTHLAHRDFQSQNLMLTSRGLVLIDFQDAFYASETYDLVALLRDSYIRLEQTELDALLAYYADVTGQNLEALKQAFYLQTIQRKLKDSGRFVTLATRGKTGFLAYFADSIAYVVFALQQTGLFPELRSLLSRYLPEARLAEEALA